MNTRLFVRRSAAGTVGLLLGSGAVIPCPVTADEVFQKYRAELTTTHDANGDGRLDTAERGRMRHALKEQRLGKTGSGFQIPADFLAKYDANKNGELDRLGRPLRTGSARKIGSNPEAAAEPTAADSRTERTRRRFANA